MKPKIIICDLDGTLCDISRRIHLHPAYAGADGTHKAFHSSHRSDKVIEPIRDLLRMSACTGEIYTYLLTGRPDDYFESTKEWLAHHQVPYFKLRMRRTSGQEGHASETGYKSSVYKQEIKPNYETMLAIDDRDKTVAMWRGLGIVCLQCKEGEY